MNNVTIKALIMFVTLISAAILILVFWNKTGILQAIDQRSSPVWVDLVFFALGASMAISRATSIIYKLVEK